MSRTEFGRLLKEFRKGNGLSIAQAAFLCKCGSNNYANYENGARRPPRSEPAVRELAHHLILSETQTVILVNEAYRYHFARLKTAFGFDDGAA